jgi:hypothetical protein
VEIIRKGIAEGKDTSVCLVNYKADGTPFWNQFFVAPLRDLNKNVVYYVGAQCVVEKPIKSDDEEVRTGAELSGGRGQGQRRVIGLGSWGPWCFRVVDAGRRLMC